MKTETAGVWRGSLTEDQKRLVEQNVGLVAVHIRRKVPGVGRDCSGREYDDLFQEGCCGLIQAARVYDAARGIPFAAFALPRIHTAISTSLTQSSTLIRRPRRRRRESDGNTASSEKRKRGDRLRPHPADDSLPTIRTLDMDPADRSSRHRPDRDRGGDTLGDRVRSRYDLAVCTARKQAGKRKTVRDDRMELVDKLIEQRLHIAEPTSKTALREIARATGSSYSRVLQCERQLQESVRRALAADLEFRELIRLGRRNDEGLDRCIDEQTDTRLRQLAAQVFRRRLVACSEQRKAELMLKLFFDDEQRLERFVDQMFAELPRETSDALLLAVIEQS